ncbi:nickel-dependent hydrogenase large subunit [Azospirillum sp. A39]|uniref:nickel-dependent hydrogenase large subunit n=1 Tax=Azospirillum sp. A39 TaxID=3462279 RepID=UPI0040463EA6
MTAAGTEGAVVVRLHTAAGTVRDARVAVRRPTAAARALTGRTVAETLRLVPLLYSVCGTAQGVAAVAAAEAALDLRPDPAHAAARELLVLAETAASHAWQALMDWPRLLGEASCGRELAPLRAAAAALTPALYPAGDALRPGGGGLRPDRPALHAAVDRIEGGVAAAVLGGAPAPADAESLAAWAAAGATPAARLLARALAPDGAAFGAAAVAPLPDLPAAWFAERLAGDPGFSARPHNDGAPALTGPFARMADHPVVAALTRRHGAGIAAHFAARLVELAALPGRLRAGVDALGPADPAGTEDAGTGTGTGVVETARGRLAHWLRLEDGRVADYRTVAPTEWNFAADGALARGLAGVAADAGLHGRATLLVAALDPCVAADVAVVAAAAPEA